MNNPSLWPLLLLVVVTAAHADGDAGEAQPGHASDLTPDIRDSDVPLKARKGNFVAVPIPISNPTIGSGLVAGGGYFYQQSDEQKKSQPASVTAAAGFYTDSDSYGVGILQQNYWDENRWRLTGAVGYANLNLALLADDGSGSSEDVAWHIEGAFAFARLSRQVIGKWYAGALGRYVDISQSIQLPVTDTSLDTAPKIRSVGLGATFEYDNRDMPINTYAGNHFLAELLFNDERIGSSKSYQSYKLGYSSYHELSSPWVLAWEVSGCKKTQQVPIWDACLLDLRGFPATNYLGKEAVSAQLEARWRMSKRWGLVGFAGAGYMGATFEGIRERETIPSYGLGLRFMVLPAKRINLRLDYARSVDSDAIYVSVGEAF